METKDYQTRIEERNGLIHLLKYFYKVHEKQRHKTERETEKKKTETKN